MIMLRFAHATVIFDTHKFIRRLKEAGISDEQVEAFVILIWELRLRKINLREPECRFIIKLGAMIVVAISIVATLVKLL